MILPRLTEHQVQTQLQNWLQYHNYYVIRLNSGMIENKYGGRIRLGVAGTPDLLAIKDGKATFIEVKRDLKSKPTALQMHKMEELRGYGSKCFVACSIEDLEAAGL